MADGVSLLSGGGPDAAPTTGFVLRPASLAIDPDQMTADDLDDTSTQPALALAWDPQHRAGLVTTFHKGIVRFLDLGHTPTRVASYELVVRATVSTGVAAAAGTGAAALPAERKLGQGWRCAAFMPSMRRHVLFALEPGHQLLLTSLPMANDAKVLKAEELLLRDPDGSRVVVFGEHERAINCLAVDDEGTIVASGCQGGRVRLWGVDGHDWGSSTDFLMDEQAHDGEGGVSDLRFTAEGMGLVSAGPDCVRFWDADSGMPLQIFHVDAPVTAIALSLRRVGGLIHRTLAAGTNQGDLYFWALESGELEFLGFHSAPVTCMACRPSGDVLAIGDARGGVSLYYPDELGWAPAVESTLEAAVVGVAFRGPEPHHLCALPEFGNAKVWNGSQVPRVPPAAEAKKRRGPVARFADDVSLPESSEAPQAAAAGPRGGLRSALKGGHQQQQALDLAGLNRARREEGSEEDEPIRRFGRYAGSAGSAHSAHSAEADGDLWSDGGDEGEEEEDEEEEETPRARAPVPVTARASARARAPLPEPPAAPTHPFAEREARPMQEPPVAHLGSRFVSRERARRLAEGGTENELPRKEASEMQFAGINATLGVRRQLQQLEQETFDDSSITPDEAARERASRALAASRKERLYKEEELVSVEPDIQPPRRAKKQLHPRWVAAQALKPALADACTSDREPVVLIEALPPLDPESVLLKRDGPTATSADMWALLA